MVCGSARVIIHINCQLQRTQSRPPPRSKLMAMGMARVRARVKFRPLNHGQSLGPASFSLIIYL